MNEGELREIIETFEQLKREERKILYRIFSDPKILDIFEGLPAEFKITKKRIILQNWNHCIKAYQVKAKLQQLLTKDLEVVFNAKKLDDGILRILRKHFSQDERVQIALNLVE